MGKHVLGRELEHRAAAADRRAARSRFGSSFSPAGSGVDPLIAPQETELGNIAAIFKFLLWEDEGIAVSAGLGVEIPTAKDVDYGLAINGVLPFPNNPGLSGDTQAGFLTIVDNETVYLDPFLAWVVKPGDRWFHQGFLQVNVAANPTRGVVPGTRRHSILAKWRADRTSHLLPAHGGLSAVLAADVAASESRRRTLFRR